MAVRDTERSLLEIKLQDRFKAERSLDSEAYFLYIIFRNIIAIIIITKSWSFY